MADGVQQVGLAAAGGAMEEERVEGDLLTGGEVCAALNATSLALPTTKFSNR
jgi:hypothetical protein